MLTIQRGLRFFPLLAAAALALVAASAHADYRVETVAEGLEHPWSLAFLPDGGMLVTERPGRLRRIDAEGRLSDPLPGVPEVFVAGQGGLKEVALAADFADSGRLFLSYSCGTRRANNTCLASARLDGDALTDVVEIFRARPDKSGAAHYGGRIAFLDDGTLLLTLGDAFVLREEAQNKANHLGTIVRLNPDGSVPADNPFVDHAGVAPEIFSYGHRNVQGIVVESGSGRIFSHEHGPRGGDELNLIEAGENYGWPLATHGVDYTGARVSPYTSLPGMRDPLLDWTPSIAPAGMTRYVGALFPDWQGDLLVAALAGQAVHRVRLDDTRVVEEEVLFRELDRRLRDVRTGPDGALYLLTDHRDGAVLRVLPAGQ